MMVDSVSSNKNLKGFFETSMIIRNSSSLILLMAHFDRAEHNP